MSSSSSSRSSSSSSISSNSSSSSSNSSSVSSSSSSNWRLCNPNFQTGVDGGDYPHHGVANRNEISGMVHSRQHANILWGVSDGNAAELICFSPSGTDQGIFTLSSNFVTTNADKESLSYRNIGGTNYIFVGDTGDNGESRTDTAIYRIVEPSSVGSNATISNSDIEKILYRFDDNPGGAPDLNSYDCECILVDTNGDIYLITKREPNENRLYKIPYMETYTGTTNADYVGTIYDIPTVAGPSSTGSVVGGTISSDGREVILKNYDNCFYFCRESLSTSMLSMLQGTPATIAYVGLGNHPSQEPQGEAIAFDANDNGYYSLSEQGTGSGATAFPIFYYSLGEPSSSSSSQVSSSSSSDLSSQSSSSSSKNLLSKSFQDGDANSYTGTLDTYVWDTNPNTSYGTEVTMVSDLATAAPGGRDSDERRALLRFDNIFGNGVNQVPYGSIITRVEIDLYIATAGSGGLGWDMHRCLKTWDESSTYNSLTNGMPADDVSAQSATDASRPQSAGDHTRHDIYDLNASGVATVQAWASGAPNYGWVIAAKATDGQQHATSDGATQSENPKITIYYYEGSSSSSSSTSSQSSSSSSQSSSSSSQSSESSSSSSESSQSSSSSSESSNSSSSSSQLITGLPQYAGNIISNFAGTSNLTFMSPELGKVRLAAVLTTNQYNGTTIELMLGGYPIGLAQEDGRYILRVIAETLDQNEDEEEIMFGANRVLISRNGDEWCLQVANIDQEDVIVGETIFNGLPLALNYNNTLIFSQVSGSIEETAYTYYGGFPIKIGRVGSQWFPIVVIRNETS